MGGCRCPAGGVLLLGLLGGHLGFVSSAQTQSFGFAVFIFCVGYQAGPQFFDVVMRGGLKYLSLALVVAATGVLLSIWLASLLEFAPGLAAGMMGGAMTTTRQPSWSGRPSAQPPPRLRTPPP